MVLNHQRYAVIFGAMLLGVLALALAATVLHAQPAPEGQLIEQITQLMNQRNFEQAVEQSRRLLELYPDSQVRDVALYRLATCYSELKRPQDAIVLLVDLRKRYPDSIVLVQATILLFKSYLAQGDRPSAEGLWQEIFVRWPKTEYAWQAADANYRDTAAKDPEKALAKLEELAKTELLPAAGVLRVRLLRLDAEQKATPEQFLTDALALFGSVKDAGSIEEVKEYAALARRLYAALLPARRFDEAKQINSQLQEAMKRVGNPKDLLEGNTLAYFDSLQRADITRFLAEIVPTVTALSQMTDPAEMTTPTTLIRCAYPALIAAEKWTDAQAVHEKLQAALVRLNRGDLVKSDNDAYLNARLSTLERTKPEQFADETLALIKQIGEVRSADEIQVVSGLARRAYEPLMKAKRFDEAKAVHERMQTILAALKNPYNWQLDDSRWYFSRLKNASTERLLQAIIPEIEQWMDAKTKDEVVAVAELAAMAYGPLLNTNRQEEAEKLHQAVQESLAAFPQQGEADTSSFLDARLQGLDLKDPTKFLEMALPLIARAGEAKTIIEVNIPASLARRAYEPLIKQKRIDEAKAMHARMQEILLKLEPAGETATVDSEWYFSRLESNPAVFLEEALAVTAKLPRFATVNALQQAARTVMGRIYPQLMKAGRVEDAQAVHEQFLAACARLTALGDMQQADTRLYLTELAKAKPALFLEQAKPYLMGEIPLAAVPDLQLAIDLACAAYGPLYQADRPKEAVALHERLGKEAERLKQKALLASEQAAFIRERLTDLSQRQPEQFLTEVLQLAGKLKEAKASADVEVPVYVAGLAYTPLMRDWRREEADALHEQVQAALTRMKLAELAQQDQRTYMAAVGMVNGPKFIEEALPIIAKADTAITGDEIRLPAEMARKVYWPLMQSGRMADARTVHDKMQRNLARLKNVYGWQAEDLKAFQDTWCNFMLTSAPADVFLAETKSIFETIADVKDRDEVVKAYTIAPRAYTLFMQMRCPMEAKVIHSTLMAAGARFDLPREVKETELSGYLLPLAPVDPVLFLADALPLAQKAPEIKSVAEMQVTAAITGAAYPALMQTGRFEDALALHAQMQTTLAKLEGGAEMRMADNNAYVSSPNEQSINAMVLLTKRALAADDPASAKKWYGILRDLAAEYPKVREVGRLLKDVEAGTTTSAKP